MKIRKYLTFGLRYMLFGMAFAAPLPALCENQSTDCIRGEPVPAFEAKQPGVRSHRFVPSSKYVAIEYLILASGASVDIKHGGCEYFMATIRFNSKDTSSSEGSTSSAYKAAATALRRLQHLKGDSGFNLRLAAETLESAVNKKPAPRFGEPLAVEGDGVEFLQTQVQVDAAGRKSGTGFVQVSLYKGPL